MNHCIVHGFIQDFGWYLSILDFSSSLCTTKKSFIPSWHVRQLLQYTSTSMKVSPCLSGWADSLMAPLFALVRRVRLTTPTLTPTPPTTFHSESGNSLRGSWGKKRCCIWSYHRCTMSNAERESFMKPLTAVLSSLQQKSGRLEPLNKILCVSQLRKTQTWIACGEWMAARAWVYLCARQRTNSKPRTSFFLFLQTTCLSVCYNNSTTKKVMSHSQSGVLHNAPWLHSAPNRNSSTLSARWALSSQLSAALAVCWALRQSIWRKTVSASVATFSAALQTWCYNW